MTDGEPVEHKQEPEDLDRLLADSAAVMQRWKKAASEITADSVGTGRDVIVKVYIAAKAFQGLDDSLSSHGLLNESKDHLFF